MENITVYPFGQGGQLPSGYPIVNDLTTGGADKALSAEMGKTLNDAMNGTTREVVVQLDITNATRYNFIINSTNKWAAASSGEQCVLISLANVKKVSVTMDGSNGIIAFLKNADNIAAGNTPNFATGETARRQVTNGNSQEFTVPVDANILYVTTHSSTAEISQNYDIDETVDYYTGGFIERTEIVDNLLSDNADVPLSAKQGKILNEKVANRFAGKKISIIGDSISCFGTENQTRTAGYNAPYWIVKSCDVGETIQSWVTWLDVYTSVDGTTPTNKTIGGVTLTAAMIGTKQTFTPIADDVGKAIGVPRWANAYTTKPWWQVLIEKTGAVLCNNASWSGSRIIPIPEGNTRHDAFVLSEAYSEYTLKRVCNRDDEGNAIVPDVIIIYRGTNDFSAEDPEGGVVSDDDESITTPNMMTFNGITDVHNFTQGYIWTILKLRELYPNAYIVLCTLNIFKRVNYSRFPVNNGTYTLPDYNNKIREIADLMGCGLIELDKDGITFENCYPTYISDNATTPTHPNTNGHRVMGEKAVADLTYVLNAED